MVTDIIQECNDWFSILSTELLQCPDMSGMDFKIWDIIINTIYTYVGKPDGLYTRFYEE